jgi:protein-S-isoprenylcysteine O-methyltransferase Ste14
LCDRELADASSFFLQQWSLFELYFRYTAATESMQKPSAILGSAFFLLLAPGVVGGYVPWRISHWQMRAPLLGISVFRVLGVFLIVAGSPMVLDSFARFAIQGLGTPAPVFPTKHLVVTGLYRHVRNPMYVGVIAIIAGQGLLLGDLRTLGYGALVWFAFHLFVRGYEEPKLTKTFGEEYREFCRNVPRWLPRARAWHSNHEIDGQSLP